MPVWLGSLVVSPVARYVAIGVAVFSFVIWQRQDAANTARQEAEAACVLNAEERRQAEITRQQLAAKAAIEAVEQRALVAENERRKLKEKADDLVAELDASSATCAIPPDLARRLRDIR